MINGNKKLTVQLKSAIKNSIGESIQTWEDAQSFVGWLDLVTGDSSYATYKTKVSEASHIFIADYKKVDKRIKPEKARAICDGEVYDVRLIDDPMNMHAHLEIYLRYTGGQEDG